MYKDQTYTVIINIINTHLLCSITIYYVIVQYCRCMMWLWLDLSYALGVADAAVISVIRLEVWSLPVPAWIDAAFGSRTGQEFIGLVGVDTDI